MDAPRNDELAVRGFANGPLYNSARPDYPIEAVEYLVLTLHLDTSSRVIDLGAGTGIFSRQMLPFVGKLTAVDPSASMRESLIAESPAVEVLEGSDVAIPLQDHSVEAVFAAQAFHWFDAPRALVEIHRVLTKGGGLGLIWNERDESVEWVHDLGRAMHWHEEQPYEVGTDFSKAVAAGPFTDVVRVQFPHAQTLTRDGLYQRVLTTSYISIMEDGPRAELMKEVQQVVEKLSEPFVLPYVTEVYTATADLIP
jgi:SAM-dependent methyltransferase